MASPAGDGLFFELVAGEAAVRERHAEQHVPPELPRLPRLQHSPADVEHDVVLANLFMSEQRTDITIARQLRVLTLQEKLTPARFVPWLLWSSSVHRFHGAFAVVLRGCRLTQSGEPATLPSRRRAADSHTWVGQLQYDCKALPYAA